MTLSNGETDKSVLACEQGAELSLKRIYLCKLQICGTVTKSELYA